MDRSLALLLLLLLIMATDPFDLVSTCCFNGVDKRKRFGIRIPHTRLLVACFLDALCSSLSSNSTNITAS